MSRKQQPAQRGWVYLALLAAALLAGRAQAGVLDDVRAQFNRDKGSPRLVVLVSPT